MSKLGTSLLGIALAVVLFFGINILAQRTVASRIDLTEKKLYTLSEGTKHILAGLDQDVKLHYFYSKKNIDEFAPEVNSWAERVLELLQEYEAESNGRLTLEVYDPEPFSEAEERAVGFGLRGQSAGRPGEQIYLGLVGTNETDGQEAIPVLAPNREQFLEYDVTKLVSALVRTEQPVVGLMTALPVRGGVDQRTGQRTQGWFTFEQANELFEVRAIETSATKIPDDVQILVVVHPQNFTPPTLYAIDQFVLRGGKLVAFVDPHCELQMPPPDPQNPMAGFQAEVSSNLEKLFTTWGVELVRDKLAGDKDYARAVNFQGAPTSYLVWLNLKDEAFEKEDPIVADLNELNLASAGILRKLPEAPDALAFGPLLHTSTNSDEIDRYRVALGPDPGALLGEFQPSGEELALAARLTGTAKTAFPDGKPKAPGQESADPEDPEHPHLSTSTGPVHVVVVADVDMLQDAWWVRVSNLLGTRIAQPMADNGNFFINILDNLSGSNDLISLRSRGNYVRPFTKLTEIRAKADAEYRDKEKALVDKLRETERELDRLQSQRADDSASMLLTPEQREQIEKFREEQNQTRKQLRQVRHEMNEEIETLGARLAGLNIVAVPLVVLLVAVVLFLFTRGRTQN